MWTGQEDPARPKQYFQISWEMFGELCRALALRVAQEYEPEVVVGIARAGVVPAGVMASILRTDLYAMTISRRQGSEHVRERPEVLSAAPSHLRGKRVLIVDEIATSGDTLRMALAAVRDVGPAEVRTATCFVRPREYRPDFFALETDQELIFPWDRKVFQEGELVVNPRYRDVLDE
ncbi:MAG TPA: phosphoribosyltransferase family protein [Longimicrobiales bacterium]|nr:phosphoribosyltransferase family protein [Longimicrobiales bacterium]